MGLSSGEYNKLSNEALRKLIKICSPEEVKPEDINLSYKLGRESIKNDILATIGKDIGVTLVAPKISEQLKRI